MICDLCLRAAKIDRKVVDKGHEVEVERHPRNCGCYCQHKNGPWEKLYSVGRPDEEAGTAKD